MVALLDDLTGNLPAWTRVPIAISAAAAVVVTFWTIRGIYRVHLHPLSKFPGPKEAAWSHDWVYRQTLTDYPESIYEQLHKKYKTRALRIAPDELHITDPTLYKVIYKQANPFPKVDQFYLGFMALSPTAFTDTNPHTHRERRRMLNNLFSKASVLKLEKLIFDSQNSLLRKIDRLCDHQLIDIYGAMRLITTTVIMEFAFADSGNMIEEQPISFSSRFLQAFSVGAESVGTMQRYPLARTIAKTLPAWLIKMMDENIGAIDDMISFSRAAIQRYHTVSEQGKAAHLGYPIVLDNLQTLDLDALVAESLDLLIAGSDTSATSLTTTILELLSNPTYLKTLVDELDAAIPDKHNFPAGQELEKLPFLSSCVKEGIRHAKAVPGRLPRYVPDDGTPFVVDGEVVPPGTIVSISAYTMHMDTDFWGPDARYFNPNRWLADDAKRLDEYSCAFGKGARMCLGMNLVPFEMTIVLATLFRNFTLELPSGFTPPRSVDNFTVEFPEGLYVRVSRRD
ncbi:cytochrome P450 [Microdochium trichocladiopsis]|uniref:Cytochrome P450 n=1 Tax=Microdochium trichocladiopsis TaxID=1682393 RepID=A0A9P8Y4V8_9PEZI|nr:cytochrome P450 [Microdochium trichocladiopsis]KAH7029778.1 cytochrome P450 [Microdochium trichocladiopsis]